MGDSDICGSTDTTSGEPCQFSPGESCPWHDSDSDPNTRNTLLEENTSLIDVVAGALQRGDTVPEACSEAGISTDQYYDWKRRGKESEDTVFSEFSEEVTHARRVASKKDRSRLKELALENADTRTLYKIHHDQYGDTYGQESEDGRETGSRIVIHDNEQSYNKARQN